MTQSEIYTLLQSTGLPVVYIQSNEPKPLPYIVYMVDGEEQRGSDFKNVICEKSYRVELYTTYNDTQSEGTLDNVLNCVEFSKDKVKIESEEMMMTVYSFDTIEKI